MPTSEYNEMHEEIFGTESGKEEEEQLKKNGSAHVLLS